MGLPSPGAAGILASYVLLSRWSGFYDKGVFMNKVMGWYEENLNAIELYGVPILTVIIAVVMVSTIPYPSLKKLNREFIKPWTLAFIGSVLIALVNCVRVFVLHPVDHLPFLGNHPASLPKKAWADLGSLPRPTPKVDPIPDPILNPQLKTRFKNEN